MCGESGYFQGDIAFSSNDIPLLLKVGSMQKVMSLYCIVDDGREIIHFLNREMR